MNKQKRKEERLASISKRRGGGFVNTSRTASMHRRSFPHTLNVTQELSPQQIVLKCQTRPVTSPIKLNPDVNLGSPTLTANKT